MEANNKPGEDSAVTGDTRRSAGERSSASKLKGKYTSGKSRLLHAFAVLSLALPMLTVTPACAEELTIAVASNFTAPMREIAANFEAQSGHKIRIAFGSSGKIFAQIHHGAPYQAFFSADREKPSRLVEGGFAVASSQFTYAEGRLALWSRTAGLVDDQGGILAEKRYNKLAIANPKLAPYGAAAVQVLKNLDLLEASRPHWVQGENIAQTYQFVATGNADLGMVALSQITQDNQITGGSAWIIPETLYSPIRQDAVQLGESAALDEFWHYLKSEDARNIIQRFGYQIPEAD